MKTDKLTRKLTQKSLRLYESILEVYKLDNIINWNVQIK
jgi:hypothetical protein